MEGATTLGSQSFADLSGPFIGHDANDDDLQALTQAITARYRRQGYFLAQAKLGGVSATGVVTIQVFEGFIDQVHIDGQVRGDQSLLLAALAKIQAERPLTLATLERYVLLVQDFTGASARAVFSPSKTVLGAADLSVVVSEPLANGYIGVDNYGSEAIGPEQISGSITFHGVFNRFDQTSLQMAAAPDNELWLAGLSHAETLDTEGDAVSFGATYSHTKPHGPLSPFQGGRRFHGGQLEDRTALYPFADAQLALLDQSGCDRFQFKQQLRPYL